jgi:hypothetical protein
MKSQEQEFLPIVNDLVASQYVDEAIKILNAASPARVNEFMNYYLLVIDFINFILYYK